MLSGFLPIPPSDALITPRVAASEGELTWVRTGGPLGGLGYDVRMRPDNPDVMYVTDAWTGVFMSTDGGRNWSPSSEGITTRTGESGDAIPVFSLTIDPNDHDILWAGTQFQRGIFKSTDGGRTWTEMSNGVVEREGITFRGFAVDPRSSGTVYAAAEVSSWAWNGQELRGREFDLTKGVVYKTTDGGKSWQAAWRGDNLARYVWIDPRNPDVVYVSTGIFDREAANSDPTKGTPGGVGIIKSTDGGRTWTQVNRGLKNLYIGSLFMHPQNPDILLAGAGNNQYHDGAGVYLTTDGGANWRQTLKGDRINIVGGIESVEFSPSDPNIAYAGSVQGIYRSEDGGRTWKKVAGGSGPPWMQTGWGAPGVRAGFPIDMQVDPRDPNRIFVNNYGGGNFLSTDGGRTWKVASKGYTGAQVRDIAVDPTAAGRVFAASRSGFFLSNDSGDTWTGLNYPPAPSLEWNAVAVDPADLRHVLAANNWNNAILHSQDGGRTWRVTNASFEGDARAGWRVIAFAPSDPKTVYAGSAGFFSAGSFDPQWPGRGIYVSHDGGGSWAPSNTPLSQDAHVTALAVDPGDSQKVYATTSNLGVLRSAEGGGSWEAINRGLPGSPQAFSIAIHPGDPAVIFTGLRQGGLYRSEDGGQTWRLSGAGLIPEASVSDILFDPANPQIMYAADLHSGVYRSGDGGRTWNAVTGGLSTRAVNALAISADGGHLYAATEGGGVFRLDLTGQPPVAVPVVAVPDTTATDQAATPTPEPSGGGVLRAAAAAMLLAVLVLVGLILLRRRHKG